MNNEPIIRDRKPPLTGRMAERGRFFAVDRLTWGDICEQLDTNAAAAYLVMASGTGADNVTTSWSVNAVQNYLGLSLGRARAAVRLLQDAAFVECVHPGTRPRYKLRLCHALTDAEWIWLPNAVIEGVGAEVSPIERLRQTQDVLTLRLFADCYGGQQLAEHEGIDPRIVRQTFERVRVGQQGPYVVWGFRPLEQWVTFATGFAQPYERQQLTADEKKAGANTAVDFFPRFGQLESLGLVEWIPHLVESATIGSQPVHPCRRRWGSRELVDMLGCAAHVAAAGMLTDGQRQWASKEGLSLVPVPAHMLNVAMVGIARLTYRPQTRVTAAWFANLQQIGAAYLQKYRDLADEDLAAAAGSA